MNAPAMMRLGSAVLALAMAGGWLAGCGGKQAPVTGPGPSKPSSAVPSGGAHAPATAVQGPAAAAAVVVAAVAAAAPNTPAPARQPAPDPLVGPVTRAALENYETWKTLRAEDDTPDPAAVTTIGQHGRDVQVLVIVATWCPDSKREVPRFFKIYDLAGVGLDSVSMVAVDRSKKDAGGLTVKHEILRVPTFVFFRGGKEVGRVTERAITTLEQDIAAIMTK